MIWLLKFVVMLFVVLGIGRAIVVEIWESIDMEIKTIVTSIWAKLWPQKKSVMSPERYNELMGEQDLKLTQPEIDEGWFFCCEWDGLLIQKTWMEAICCSCLPEDERPDPGPVDLDSDYFL